jgi:hypothetical protein
MRAARALLSAARDPHRVLGLAPGATRVEVRARYLALAKLLHPDSMPADVSPASPTAAPHAFAELSAAYEALSTRAEGACGVGGGRRAAAPRRHDWFEDDDHGGGELLMRLRRDYAGGRGSGLVQPSPSSACVRRWKNGEPPCYVVCSACRSVERRDRASPPR